VGILGGTFNPPHLGHLAVARHALQELELERVVLMPARLAPHKPAAEDPGPEHRLRMCELLLEGQRSLSACALELEREGPSYTVDTLTTIHASHQQAQLTFIMGADTARTLPSWREPSRLLQLTDLAVAARPSSARRGVLEIVARLSAGSGAQRPAAERVHFLDMPAIEISSSMARARAARGEPIEDLVGPPVAQYIAEQGLYRSRAEVPI